MTIGKTIGPISGGSGAILIAPVDANGANASPQNASHWKVQHKYKGKEYITVSVKYLRRVRSAVWWLLKSDEMEKVEALETAKKQEEQGCCGSLERVGVVADEATALPDLISSSLLTFDEFERSLDSDDEAK